MKKQKLCYMLNSCASISWDIDNDKEENWALQLKKSWLKIKPFIQRYKVLLVHFGSADPMLS